MGIPVLAVGSDRAWRARIERMLSRCDELGWLGTFAPDVVGDCDFSQATCCLLDGDDPALDSTCGHAITAHPIRMYFYRNPDRPTLRQCAHNGASACLDKHASAEMVLRAINAVGSGLFAVDRLLLLSPEIPAGAWPQLTPRQSETVHWALRGLSNKQIGRRLGISPETVKTHLHNAFEREGISGRMELLSAHMPESSTSTPVDAGPRWSSAIDALRGDGANRRRREDRRCGAVRRSGDPLPPSLASGPH